MSINKVDDAEGSAGPIAAWIGLITRLILPEPLAVMLAQRDPSSMEPAVHRISWLVSDEKTLQSHERLTINDEGCEVVANEELLVGGDVDSRSTRKITFKLPDGVKYEAGDHLAVLPLNSLARVLRFGACFEEELGAAAKASGRLPDEDRRAHV